LPCLTKNSLKIQAFRLLSQAPKYPSIFQNLAFFRQHLSLNGGIIVVVSPTELKANLGKNLDLVSGEDIIITRNGRKVAKLVK
jgi:hypothetical protein